MEFIQHYAKYLFRLFYFSSIVLVRSYLKRILNLVKFCLFQGSILGGSSISLLILTIQLFVMLFISVLIFIIKYVGFLLDYMIVGFVVIILFPFYQKHFPVLLQVYLI